MRIVLDLRIGARVRVSIIEERESFRERERGLRNVPALFFGLLIIRKVRYFVLTCGALLVKNCQMAY